MKRFLVLLTAVLLLPAATSAQIVTLKLATIVGNDNPFTTSALKFKEVAEAKSGGRIKVEVYPAGQLAKNEIVQLEGMQLGTVDVAAMSLPSIGGKFDPKMLATDIPFLYTGREHVWKVHEGAVGKELMSRFEPLGAKPFCYGGRLGLPRRALEQARDPGARRSQRADDSRAANPDAGRDVQGVRRQSRADDLG